MNIYSNKFAIIVIIILVCVLALQVSNNSNSNQLIDSKTCELYIIDQKINAKKYLNEFDSKCLDFKNLNP